MMGDMMIEESLEFVKGTDMLLFDGAINRSGRLRALHACIR